eukprot:gene5951-4260_t
MSIYAGLSLKEIYIKRCQDYRIKCNSALVKTLPTIPDDFHSLRILDISKNFVGPKGIVPLMHVMECCTDLQALDLRSQQLNKESIDLLCATLRTHRSVRCINLSDNPLNITAGVSLLELCKQNANIEEVLLFNTQIRGTMLNLIESQVRSNLEAKGPRKEKKVEDRNAPSGPQATSAPAPGPAAAPSGTGAAAAQALRQEKNHSEGALLSKRIPPTVIKHTLTQYPSTVHPFLLDRDPMPTLSAICEQTEQLFYDTQFPADCRETQKLDNYIYGAKNFKRVTDIYHRARVFPDGEDLYELPMKIPSGFEWIFTCLRSSIRTLKDLRNLLLLPHSSDKCSHTGIYGARLFIDGAWRYVFVDDFLPVDHQGTPIFTKAIEDPRGNVYIWPCMLEKLLAKVHGGYNALDANIGNPESDLHHQLFRDPIFSEVKETCPPPRLTTCARLMADLTGGVNVVRYMHRDGFDMDGWWKNLAALLDTDPPTIAVAVSRNKSRVMSGIDPSWVYQILQARQINGLRLVELSCHDCVSSWQGSWCDESPDWEEFPDVAALLHRARPARSNPWVPEGNEGSAFKPTVKQPASFHTSGRAIKRSVFWMSYVDFVTAFEEVHVCRTFQGFHDRVIGGSWECKSSGGHVRTARWYANPHFRFRVDSRSPCFVNLALRDSRFTQNDIDSISFQILKSPKFPIVCPESSSPEDGIVFKPKYYRTESLSFEGVLDPGDDYWVVPNTFISGQMGSFFLRICSTSSFIITEENLKDHWFLHTVDCDVGGAGELQFGEGTAQVSIALKGWDEDPTYSPLASQDPDDFDKGLLIVKAARKLPTVEDQLPWDNDAANAKVPLALLLIENENSNEGTRISGDLQDNAVVAQTPFRPAEFADLEAYVSKGRNYNVVCCAETLTANMSIQFHIWSSIPIARVVSLPPWEKKTVSVEWSNGSGTYYHANNNPQVEVYPVHAKERLVVRMSVSDYSEDSAPVITFFAIRNKGRCGELFQGLVPTDRIITRSPYVRHHWVQCEIHVDEDMDSLLLMPCLQPVGSKGKCLMEIYSDIGGMGGARGCFTLRFYSTVIIYRSTKLTYDAPPSLVASRGSYIKKKGWGIRVGIPHNAASRTSKYADAFSPDILFLLPFLTVFYLSTDHALF